ncbi:Uu.00g051550.m01.CDS01 [Anthostomella pinea]|uniref:Uu.00g051550.m01.CDS01 n=1 Tax=Anthostomella pinea TaxID=933095 RepID=A0AAI8VU22_9PEZI|nr:Uu.00g051550.m01.CDS01 [Anthostomella pinea]
MPTYLITQATGQQGGWTITHLLAAGATVHALVRDPQKIPSTLQRPGVTLFEGDNEDSGAIFRAAQGCKGVFLNTYPSYTDVTSEGRQAQTILDACKKAGVEAVVAATALYTGNKELWGDDESMKLVGGYYTSKTSIEDAVHGAGLKAYTILRTGFVHSNYLLPAVHRNIPALPQTGELDHAFDDGVRLPHIDEHDFGKYAAAALLDPAKFDKQEIEMGNESLTIEEVRDIIARVSGRDVKVKKRTAAEIEEASTTVPAQRFHLWANIKDLSMDTQATVDKFGIPFTSLEVYLEREKSRLLECLPSPK